MNTLPTSILPDVNNSLQITLAGAGAQQVSAAIGVAPAVGQNINVPSLPVIITAAVACFIRQGAVCLADGTDRYVPANTPLIFYVRQGNTIAVNGPTAGNIYITAGG